MFYYSNQLPVEGTIVVACLTNNEDNENCIYVTLPEYNNFRGILYKRELPKRVKHQKKVISEMKQAGQIVCVVSTTPKYGTHGHPELIELSMKGVDQKHHPALIVRQKNIEKILKIVKFIHLHFGHPFEDLVKGLHENKIEPLIEMNDSENVDTYTELYLHYLRNYEEFLKLLMVPAERLDEISKQISEMIKETDGSVTLDFDLFVWKAEKDVVFVQRALFAHLLETYTDQRLELRYVGAPSYQLSIPQIDSKSVDNLLSRIKETIQSYLMEQKVTGFDLKFDIGKKHYKPGDISIAFPYKVETSG